LQQILSSKVREGPSPSPKRSSPANVANLDKPPEKVRQ
jgi:hypothetical protein